MLPAWLLSEDSCIICMLFYLVGSDVRQAHDQPHASLCHELAGQWINLSTNSFKAQAQPCRPGGLCRPWPWEGPGRSWAVRSSLCCRNAAARQVPGLGPAETTIKLFVWAGISIKTIGKKKSKGWIVQDEVQGFTSHPWKGIPFYAVQCFRLSYYDWLSTFRILLPIINSVGRRNMF